MQELSKIYVGLEVHKDSICVAVAETCRSAGRLIGKLAHDVNKLLKVLGKLGAAGQLHLVYETGPTGYGLQRALTAKGYLCQVISPSKIPRLAGDRSRPILLRHDVRSTGKNSWCATYYRWLDRSGDAIRAAIGQPSSLL